MLQIELFILSMLLETTFFGEFNSISISLPPLQSPTHAEFRADTHICPVHECRKVFMRTFARSFNYTFVIDYVLSMFSCRRDDPVVNEQRATRKENFRPFVRSMNFICCCLLVVTHSTHPLTFQPLSLSVHR